MQVASASGVHTYKGIQYLNMQASIYSKQRPPPAASVGQLPWGLLEAGVGGAAVQHTLQHQFQITRLAFGIDLLPIACHTNTVRYAAEAE